MFEVLVGMAVLLFLGLDAPYIGLSQPHRSGGSAVIYLLNRDLSFKRIRSWGNFLG
jgi:hypothetical protein